MTARSLRPAVGRMLGALRTGRVGEWRLILQDYLVWQSLVQFAAALAGFLIVNRMPLRQYAFYTLTMSAVTSLTLCCDLGITVSLMYFRREASLRSVPFDVFVREGQRMRRGLLLVSAPIFVLVFARLAARGGFVGVPAHIATALVLGAVWFNIREVTGIFVLRVSHQYRDSYRAEVTSALFRLTWAAMLAITSLMYALLAVTGNIIGSALAALVAWRSMRTRHEARGSPVAVAAARRDIVRYIVPTLPGAIYFAFQGTLLVWLSATFGGTESVAQVGALGRLAVLVGLVSGIIPTVIVPRLASVLDPHLYRRRYLQYGALVTLVALVLVGLAVVAPGWCLLLLGRQYSGLEREVLLAMATAAASLVSGYCVAINQARAWNRLQPLALVVLLGAQVALALTLPLSSTAGLLVFGLLSALVGLGAQLLINVIGFVRADLSGHSA